MGAPASDKYRDLRTLDGLAASARFTESSPGVFTIEPWTILLCLDPASRTVYAPIADLAHTPRQPSGQPSKPASNARPPSSPTSTERDPGRFTALGDATPSPYLRKVESWSSNSAVRSTCGDDRMRHGAANLPPRSRARRTDPSARAVNQIVRNAWWNRSASPTRRRS